MGEFRQRVFEEVAASELAGLIFTYVWAFDHASDDAAYQLNSHGAFDARADYLRLDTTTLSAAETAERIISHFGLPSVLAEPLAT